MRHLLLAATLMQQPVGTAATIRQLSPRIAPEKARRLGKAIDQTAKRHGLDADILAAILAQESSFDEHVVVCYRKKQSNGCPRLSCDIGIGQINDVWVKTLKLNPCRLRQDPAYNIEAAGRILERIRKQYPEDNWWGRYHDSRERFRAPYEGLVRGRLAQLN